MSSFRCANVLSISSRSYISFLSSSIPTPLARSYSATSSRASSYENIIVSKPKASVGLVTLNRPRALNALSGALFKELNESLTELDADRDIGAIVITGNEKAFAAGADIKEMALLTFSEAYSKNFIASWSHLTTLRTPIVAAVAGYALGGGCELALMCDFIYCTSTATFGQPEIKLGEIPGAGGSQRLTAAIGKSRAMELILTGRNFSGKEAGQWGMAAQVFDGTHEDCLNGAIDTASKIAGYSSIAVTAAKEVVNKSQELSLREGVDYERRIFHALFGSKDQKLGMEAFATKKKAEWTNE